LTEKINLAMIVETVESRFKDRCEFRYVIVAQDFEPVDANQSAHLRQSILESIRPVIMAIRWIEEVV
jgi:hypothetical protein